MLQQRPTLINSSTDDAPYLPHTCNHFPLQSEKFYDMFGLGSCVLLALDSLREASVLNTRKVRQFASLLVGIIKAVKGRTLQDGS
jgi:hypothetical protein